MNVTAYRIATLILSVIDARILQRENNDCMIYRNERNILITVERGYEISDIAMIKWIDIVKIYTSGLRHLNRQIYFKPSTTSSI